MSAAGKLFQVWIVARRMTDMPEGVVQFDWFETKATALRAHKLDVDTFPHHTVVMFPTWTSINPNPAVPGLMIDSRRSHVHAIEREVRECGIVPEYLAMYASGELPQVTREPLTATVH